MRYINLRFTYLLIMTSTGKVRGNVSNGFWAILCAVVCCIHPSIRRHMPAACNEYLLYAALVWLASLDAHIKTNEE